MTLRDFAKLVFVLIVLVILALAAHGAARAGG
jgi:Tfp pilus assembly protein PilX